MEAPKTSSLEKDIVQLIYCSQASLRKHHFDCEQNLKNILDYSVIYNSLHKITGILLTDKKFFAQIIEGPPSEINLLYGNVLHDERHHGVTLLQYTVTNVRLFPQWSMGLVEVDDMSYVGKLSIQSTPGDFRKACLSILKSLHPAFYGK